MSGVRKPYSSRCCCPLSPSSTAVCCGLIPLPVTHGAGRWLEREGERWLNFSSNDYLGLSQHPAIIAAWQQGATRYGVGAGGSGHVSGYSEAHRALEEALADWLGYPRALLFISGFAANQALIAALVEKDDRIAIRSSFSTRAAISA